MAQESQKCLHKSCTCQVSGDEKYCSKYCEDAHKAKVTEILCGCEHSGCTD